MKQSDYIKLQKEAEKERLDQLYRQQLQSPYYLTQQNRGYQQTRIESIEKTNDNTYVNVVIDHPEPIYNIGRGGLAGPDYYLTNQDPVVSDYGVTKTEPILDNCSDYYCSVVRFTIPLDEVPLLICPIVPNQPIPRNPDLTPLIIGIQFGNSFDPATYWSQSVIYLPYNATINPLQKPVQNQPTQVITPYYFIYSYQNIVDMFNQALNAAYIHSGLAALFPFLLGPYFEFNPETNLFSLIVPSFFTTATLPALFQPRIFMNLAAETFLFSFNTIQNVAYPLDSTLHPLGNDVFFLTEASISNQYYPPGVVVPTPTSPTGITPALPATSFYYKYTQEYSIIEYWSSLRRILIFSNTIPVKNEYVPATNNLVNSINIDQSGVNVSYPILTDFVPNISSTAGDSRSIAYYVPSSQYRLIDMISTNPLQKIDMRIFWEDREGNLYPLLISLYQQASFKLAFIRKSLYKNSPVLEKV